MILYKVTRRIGHLCENLYNRLMTFLALKGNNVGFTSYKTNGIPYIMVSRGGEMTLGVHFSMNNGIKGNPIGCYDRCTFFVDKGAVLQIGEHVGMSQAAVVCHQSITIGNHVKIGGGAKIYDTDFHSLDPKIRASKEDLKHKVKAPVVIKDHAFIGAFSVILKGVTIGENAVVGAGSIVTKSIPDNQIWAGNPAKFIKEI